MPNPPHEMLHGIFREDSHLFSRILQFAEIPFPEPEQILISTTDATETKKVLERRMDTVLEAQIETGKILIVIEAQNRANVARKLRNWAYYPAYLHELHECPVVVIVVCRNATTAAWAREPYRIGIPAHSTLVSTPIVFGPDNLPRITDVEQVIEDPYLATFCALTHAHDPEIRGILEVLATGLTKLDPDVAKNIHEIVERGLEETAALEDWRTAMAYPTGTLLPRSKWARENFEKGKAEGKVEGEVKGEAQGFTKAALRVLDLRGVELTPEAREHIAACEDVEQARVWLDESVTATTQGELTGLDAL